MLRIEKIESLDLPELEPYRTMRWQEEHRRRHVFVAEGEKVVRRLLQSSFPVISLLLHEKWLEPLTPLIESRSEPVTVFVAPEKLMMENLVGFSIYQGVLALGAIPPAPPLENILNDGKRPLLLVAADGMSGVENMGALVRNCAAFGVDAVIIGETCISPYMRRAVRSSMGAIFQMPVIESSGLAGTLKILRERGIHCVGAHPHTDRKRLSQADFTGDCCIVFGSEGHGISPEVLAACHEAVSIPMAADVDSLNVASAGAAFLYEAARQRGRA